MFCMSCGKEITGKPQYCPWCGQPIGGDSDQSEPNLGRYNVPDYQTEGQTGRHSVTMEDIERYAPMATLAPVVMGLLSLVWLVAHI